MVNILKCSTCGSYSLKNDCECGGKRNIVRPAKYSPQDKYAKYRRMAKESESSEDSSDVADKNS